MMNDGMMNMGGFMGWGGMFIGPLIMIVIAGLVIAFILMLLRGYSSGHAPDAPSSGASPLDILKTRLARGEIDKHEYEEKRRILDI